MSFFTLQNGEKLYYEITGEGEHTVLMLHGWTSTHEVFEPVLPAICEKARCITYDQRGHGNSKDANREHVTMDTLASDLDELIRGLDLHDITLLGWSMGAGVCLNYMSVYGCDALREVVLCDMTPMQLNDENWKLGLYQGKYTREGIFILLTRSFPSAPFPNLRKFLAFCSKSPL